MSTKQDVKTYSSGSIFFHWIVALLVIIMLIFGFFLDSIPDQYAPTAYMMHKSVGLTILALMLMRLLWIIHSGRPPLPASTPVWEIILARSVQYALYFFVILMPLTGWTMSVAAGKIPVFFGLFKVPFLDLRPDEALAKSLAEAHEAIALIIIGLLILHVAGALKHHFIDKDNVLKRMLPGNKEDK